MKIQELRELSTDELMAKETELRDQLFKLRFQHALGQLENAAKLRTIKKDIARIQTLLGDLGRTRTE
jgi:large subunit ribosomal protein L29